MLSVLFSKAGSAAIVGSVGLAVAVSDRKCVCGGGSVVHNVNTHENIISVSKFI